MEDWYGFLIICAFIFSRRRWTPIFFCSVFSNVDEGWALEGQGDGRCGMAGGRRTDIRIWFSCVNRSFGNGNMDVLDASFRSIVCAVFRRKSLCVYALPFVVLLGCFSRFISGYFLTRSSGVYLNTSKSSRSIQYVIFTLAILYWCVVHVLVCQYPALTDYNSRTRQLRIVHNPQTDI